MGSPMDNDEFYTAEEIAKILKVNKQWMYNISNFKVLIIKRLPCIKIGKLKRSRIGDVQRHFENYNFE